MFGSWVVSGLGNRQPACGHVVVLTPGPWVVHTGHTPATGQSLSTEHHYGTTYLAVTTLPAPQWAAACSGYSSVDGNPVPVGLCQRSAMT